jgi:hypothetical protein
MKVRNLSTAAAKNVAKKFVAREHGTQLAELAIVLPILLVLFGATAEFGRFFYTYTTLAKATRAGARYLINVPVKASEDLRAQRLVKCGTPTADCGDDEAVVSGLDIDHISITRQGPSTTVPETITVSIEDFTYEPLFDLGALTNQSISLNVEVRPSTTMRYLLSQP